MPGGPARDHDRDLYAAKLRVARRRSTGRGGVEEGDAGFLLNVSSQNGPTTEKGSLSPHVGEEVGGG
jgi:hypothetical protein